MNEEALFTDLYELFMIRAYASSGMNDTGTFELFARTLPERRGFLVAAGLEQALSYLESLRFDEDALASLARSERFDRTLLERLRGLRFTGDVDAIPEGTVVFENEPLLRVTAPIVEGQLAETRILNVMHLETVIASKAARCVLAAPGKVLVDFGARRAHGLEAGLLATRAAFVAGFAGTSLVLAWTRFGIPLYGTMAHSFVEAHDDELDAFRNFARANPNDAVFLLDTYDTEDAAREVARLAREGIPVRGVRLDSGDLLQHARNVRRILDDGGLRSVAIFVSGGLDEHDLRDLVHARAPIDGFGIGTSLDTSSDGPSLDCAYKLEEYAGRPRRKRSLGKATWPGKKQVYRQYGANGRMCGDVVTLATEVRPGEPLLVPVMRGGKRVGPSEPFSTIRARASDELQRLPEHLRALDLGPAYPVHIAASVRDLAQRIDAGR